MNTFDYVVIGGGSAGCVLARALSDNPSTQVLLLEAGPASDRFWVRTPAGMAKLFFDKELNWNYFTESLPELNRRRMYWPRGRGLGGSSSINGMIYIRGHRADFDHWRDLGNAGWGYDDVLPYFKDLEHNERGSDAYRGTGGPQWISDPKIKLAASHDFIASVENLGVPRSDDLNGELHDGVGFMQHTIKDGERHSAFSAFVKPVMNRSNLTVRANCHAQRLLVEGQRVIGVEALCGGRQVVFKAARETILSAGSLESPKLLMLSGVGPAAEIARFGIRPVHELKGVGANLQDHFYAHTAFRTTPDSSYNRRLRGVRKYLEGARYLATGGGYLSLGASQVAAFVRSRPNATYADLQISFRPMTFSWHPSGRAEVDHEPGVSASVCVLRPLSRGKVSLRSSKPSDPPCLEPNYLSAQPDIDAMIAGLRFIRRIMSTRPLSDRIVAEHSPGRTCETDDDLRQFLATTGNTASHQVGSCKMGSDEMAVVDERLRVRGLDRLRVVDASIMPHVTSGNTNASTLMIAAKGADMVLQDELPRQCVD